MKARDVMTTAVVTASLDTSIADVTKLMLSHHISGVPVVDADRHVVGIVTEGDLMRRTELSGDRRPWWLPSNLSAEERAEAYSKARGTKVGDVMTKDVMTIGEDDPLDKVAMLLETHGIKRAPVMRNGALVGIVSRANLLQGIAAAEAGETGPSDRQIRATILERAEKEAGVRIPLVGVTVSNRVAHLWGKVASEAEQDALRVVAENVDGVKEVHSHIRVPPPSVVEWDFE
jgi:CBS domain-containing protein